MANLKLIEEMLDPGLDHPGSPQSEGGDAEPAPDSKLPEQVSREEVLEGLRSNFTDHTETVITREEMRRIVSPHSPSETRAAERTFRYGDDGVVENYLWKNGCPAGVGTALEENGLFHVYWVDSAGTFKSSAVAIKDVPGLANQIEQHPQRSFPRHALYSMLKDEGLVPYEGGLFVNVSVRGFSPEEFVQRIKEWKVRKDLT